MPPDDLNLSAHAAHNRAVWNADAPNWVERGREAWASPTPWWGMWELPEAELGILPDVSGLDVVDLGCGTGYWCAWFHRLGARPVGLDLSEEQLATARELQAEHGIEFPLIHASAEAPPLPDASFDVVFSEYGAAIWCDPYVWIPEAYRLLRPGGRLIFLCNSVIAMLCSPLSDTPAGETGFEVEALHELYAADGDPSELRYYMRRGWAQQWPCEEVWVARRSER